jgi:hypothetical protein
MTSDRPVVAVVPIVAGAPDDLDPIARRLVSLHLSAPGAPIIVASGSDSDPALLDQVAAAAEELGGELVRSPAGVVAAVNAGLRAARDAGVDAVLVGDDLEPVGSDWLELLRRRTDTEGRPAAVAGAQLVYSQGLVAGAGLYFSILSREWLPRLRYAPVRLPAALTPCLCPVTGLILIRAEALAQVGVFEDELSIEHAQLDFCLRVFAAGLECIYEPAAVARRQSPPAAAAALPAAAQAEHERSTWALRRRHPDTDFSLWTPEV